MSDTVTVTVHRSDAYLLALGPLDYTVETTMHENPEVPAGGSAKRLRGALADALGLTASAAAPVPGDPHVDLGHVQATLKRHYLAGIECSHERGMDLPMCACSLVDLGWQPSVGAAVDAWITHFTAALVLDDQHAPAGEGS